MAEIEASREAGIEEALQAGLDSPSNSLPGSALHTPRLGPQEGQPSTATTPVASDTQEIGREEPSGDSIIPSALKNWAELKSTILEHKRFAVFINFEGTLVDYVGEGDFDPGYAWKTQHEEVRGNLPKPNLNPDPNPNPNPNWRYGEI